MDEVQNYEQDLVGKVEVRVLPIHILSFLDHEEHYEEDDDGVENDDQSLHLCNRYVFSKERLVCVYMYMCVNQLVLTRFFNVISSLLSFKLLFFLFTHLFLLFQ